MATKLEDKKKKQALEYLAQQEQKDLNNAAKELEAAIKSICTKYSVSPIIYGEFIGSNLKTGIQFVKNK